MDAAAASAAAASNCIPIEYFRDPGYSEWRVVAVARGTFTIRSRGTPGCSGCGLAPRNVGVTFRVA